ncbi:MAG: prolyl oligopeptidase family serine peptidase [Myxococcota bacterium]|nr:prolyl oligopeptidase family serine peptidase [Myxococcota bacterium]
MPISAKDGGDWKRLSNLATERDRFSPGLSTTIEALLADAEARAFRETAYAERIRREARGLLSAAENGKDALAAKRGFFWRGYRSVLSLRPQFYAIYVPKSYTPDRTWPLIVSLHGGQSNYNLWMALILGNNVAEKDYFANHRTSFSPKFDQDEAIIVAPQGMCQGRWRWASERDIFDVIADVQRNYAVDDNKIVLNGLSNGAIASYKVGLQHAWRFSAVLPMAGITQWETHNVNINALRPAERTVLRNESALTFAENAFNTHLEFLHGLKDSGFDVSQARVLRDRLKQLSIPHRYREIPHLGHDLTHVLWRQSKIVEYTRNFARRSRPAEVRIVTANERAGRQFWAQIDDRFDHTLVGRLTGTVAKDGAVRLTTANVRQVTLFLDEMPTATAAKIEIDGQSLSTGAKAWQGQLAMTRDAPQAPMRLLDHSAQKTKTELGMRKSPRLSGPLGDADYEPQVHVYGTQVATDTDALRKAATLGGRGWIPAPEYTQIRHPVIPDTALTESMMRERVVVLYGNAKNNSVLAKIGAQLPIIVGEKHLGLRDRQLTEPEVGARFICPNPLMPSKYLIVQAGLSAEAVVKGGYLPIYLADYVVWDKRMQARLSTQVLGRNPEVESGFFTEHWKLP